MYIHKKFILCGITQSDIDLKRTKGKSSIIKIYINVIMKFIQYNYKTFNIITFSILKQQFFIQIYTPHKDIESVYNINNTKI